MTSTRKAYERGKSNQKQKMSSDGHEEGIGDQKSKKQAMTMHGSVAT